MELCLKTFSIESGIWLKTTVSMPCLELLNFDRFLDSIHVKIAVREAVLDCDEFYVKMSKKICTFARRENRVNWSSLQLERD